MKFFYVLVANSNQAKIFLKKRNQEALLPFKEFNCEECKLHNEDLVSDKPGRVANQSSKRTKGLTPPTSAHQKALNKFVMEIVNFLEHERRESKLEGLIVVAPSHFFGKLKKKFSQQMTKLITQSIHKDYSNKKEVFIRDILNEQQFFGLNKI